MVKQNDSIEKDVCFVSLFIFPQRVVLNLKCSISKHRLESGIFYLDSLDGEIRKTETNIFP